MSDTVLPLGGAAYQGLVRVEEAGPQGMIAIRGDLGQAGLKNAATGVAGVDMPAKRGASTVGERGILWMSPDEVLVLVPMADRDRALTAIRDTLAGQHALVADVSDMRAAFRLSGPGIREVIAKLAPIDLSPGAFPVGELRRTRFAQIAAGIWFQDEGTAQVFCFRSVAEYMYNLLTTAAAPGGEVGYFRR